MKRSTPIKRRLEMPETLREISARSDSMDELAENFRLWLWQVDRARETILAAAIIDPPRLLAGRFVLGDVADEWLCAATRSMAEKHGLKAPRWAIRGQQRSRKSV